MPSILSILQTLAKVGPIVNLGYASYQGRTVADEGVDYFLGIRYAAPPIGDLRFQAPEPPLRQQNLIQADISPNRCPQANHSHPLSNVYRGAEDCLFLNVFKPTYIEEGRLLPVMVYIHEGGYETGGIDNHDPTSLIQLSNNAMVVVTLQYRLGAFGFLSSSRVATNGALNAGLLDQKFALEWVQRNIHLFGGDKDEVTIWGLSAGGGSVLNLLVAYNGSFGTSLFRGAIANSPYLPPMHPFDGVVPEHHYGRFIELAGCDDTNDTLSCLRKTETDVLKRASAMVSTSGPRGTFAWAPVLDHQFLVQRPTEQLLVGRVNGERLLAGSNMHETLLKSPRTGSYIFIPGNLTTEEHVKQYIYSNFPYLPETVYPMIQHFYPPPEKSGGRYDDMTGRIAAISGEAVLNCPSYWLVQAFPAGKAYHYEWQIPPAVHAQDLIATFPDDFPSPPQASPLRLLYGLPLVSFIIYKGDPNRLPQETVGEIAPEWPPYSQGGTQARLTVKGPVISAANELGREERCAFWRSLGSVIPY